MCSHSGRDTCFNGYVFLGAVALELDAAVRISTKLCSKSGIAVAAMSLTGVDLFGESALREPKAELRGVKLPAKV